MGCNLCDFIFYLADASRPSVMYKCVPALATLHSFCCHSVTGSSQNQQWNYVAVVRSIAVIASLVVQQEQSSLDEQESHLKQSGVVGTDSVSTPESEFNLLFKFAS